MKKQSLCWWVLLSLSASACGTSEMEAVGSRVEATPLQRPANLSNDTTPPESFVETIPEPTSQGEYYGSVSVTLTATDDAAGVDSITYSVSGAMSGGATVEGDIAYVPIIDTLGVTTITYFARDKAGNVGEPKTLEINLVTDPATCVQVSLNDYNLFVYGDYTGGHDVRGKIAAGGNITMEHFSVGAGLQADDIENVLVARGDLNLQHGGVFGNAHYGGTTTANGNTTFYRGALSQGNVVDFDTRAYELSTLSQHLGYEATANGQVRFESWGGLFLEGTDPKMNIFQVNASVFAKTRYFSINAPGQSMVVVNIYGPSATFTGFSTNFGGGIDQTGVLYNFVEATSINAHGFGFWGTVLAPGAAFTFNNGSFDGGIYAYSLTGNAEGHVNPLKDFRICGIGTGT